MWIIEIKEIINSKYLSAFVETHFFYIHLNLTRKTGTYRLNHALLATWLNEMNE